MNNLLKYEYIFDIRMYIHIFYFLVENRNTNNNPLDVNDIINDPMQALSKGWSLLSTGVGELSKVAAEGVRVAAQGAGQLGKYANENYVRPAQEQLNDPNFRNNVNGYFSAVSQKVIKLK